MRSKLKLSFEKSPQKILHVTQKFFYAQKNMFFLFRRSQQDQHTQNKREEKVRENFI